MVYTWFLGISSRQKCVADFVLVHIYVVVLNKVILLDDPVGSLKRFSYCIALSGPSIIIYAFITTVFSVLHYVSLLSNLVFDVNVCSCLDQQFDTLVEAMPGHLMEGCVAIL